MNHTSTRTLKLARLGLLGLFAAHAALAGTAPADFSQYDTDKDGVITLEEFAAQGGKPDAFKAGDVNKDGALSPDEFIKATANKDRADAGKYLDDAWITAKVKAALLKETRLKGLDVSVETIKGAVVLSGEVAKPEQVRQAETIAAGIEGVKSVRNDLRLKAQG